MAFKLDKGERTRRDDYVSDLREKWLAVQTAIEQYNERTAALHEPVDKAIEEYNELLSEARGFVEDIASTADGQIDDKSDKWQESERGQAATDWKNEWEGADLEEVSIEYPDDLTIDDADHADTLEGLPDAADMP